MGASTTNNAPHRFEASHHGGAKIGVCNEHQVRAAPIESSHSSPRESWACTTVWNDIDSSCSEARPFSRADDLEVLCFGIHTARAPLPSNDEIACWTDGPTVALLRPGRIYRIKTVLPSSDILVVSNYPKLSGHLSDSVCRFLIRRALTGESTLCRGNHVYAILVNACNWQHWWPPRGGAFRCMRAWTHNLVRFQR